MTTTYSSPGRSAARRAWFDRVGLQFWVYRLAPLVLILITTATLLFTALRFPPVWTLDVGGAHDTPAVVGFLLPTQEEAMSFRWSSANAQVLLPRTSSGMLRLHLHGDAQALASNQHIRLEQDGAMIATLPVESGWRVYEVLLPPRPHSDRAPGMVPLDLVSERYSSDTVDHDAPGLPVDWVQVVPPQGTTAPFGLPLHQTLGWTWALAILAGGLWRLDRVLIPQQSASGTSLRVSVLLGIVATGLVRWAQRDPYTLDWAWPASPWVLGLATLLLGFWVLDPSRSLLLHCVQDRLLSAVKGSRTSFGFWNRTRGREGAKTRSDEQQSSHPVTLSHYQPAILLALLVILTHLALLAPLPVAWRGIAALMILGLPGVLLALVLFQSERDPLVLAFLGLCSGLALPVLLLLALHAIPGPLPWWLALLAFDGLSVWLGWLLLRQPAADRRSKNRASGWVSGDHPYTLLGAVLLLGVAVRLPFLGNSEFQGDELHAMLRAAAVWHGQDTVLLVREKGPGEILLAAGPLVLLFGQITEWVARLPFVLAGMGILLGSYLLIRHMLMSTGESARSSALVGLIAATILALDGFLVGFARIVQYQSIVMLMMLGALWCGWRFYEGMVHPQRYLIGAAVLVAVGILAHYDTIFVVPALAWLVLAGGWRRRWQVRQWIGGLLPACVVGAGLLLSFFLPFFLFERFRARGTAYLSWRLGQREVTDLFYNNLIDYYHLASFYNTTYQMNWLAVALAAGILAWLVLYVRPRSVGWGLAALWAAGGALLVYAPERFVLSGVNWAVLVFMLPLAGLALAAATPPVLRTLVIWFGVAFMAESFLIAVPGTHFYTLAIPAAMLIGLASVRLGQWLGARRWPWLQLGLATAGVGLVLLATPYIYLVFVRQFPEYYRGFPVARPDIYRASYGDELPTKKGYFGFPHQDGWHVISELYRQGVLQGSYDSNLKRVITGWYARAFRCSPDPDYYFVGLREEGADQSIQMRIWLNYHLFGYVLTDGIRTMDIYSREPAAHPPQVFALEDYRPAFDAQPVPNFALQTILMEVIPQYPVDRIWQQGLRLYGYDLDRQQLAPGQTSTLSLFWQATQPFTADYELFVDVLDQTGTRVSSAQPYCAVYPPAEWYPYYFVDSSFSVTADPRLPPGEYTLQVGLRHTQRGDQLPLAAGADALNLTTLTVEAPKIDDRRPNADGSGR